MAWTGARVKTPGANTGAKKKAAAKTVSGTARTTTKVANSKASPITRDGKPKGTGKSNARSGGKVAPNPDGAWSRRRNTVTDTSPGRPSRSVPRRLDDLDVQLGTQREAVAGGRRMVQLVDLQHRLSIVTEVLGSKRAAAEFLDVDRSQTTRWSKGDSLPGPEQTRRLLDLEYVIANAALVWATKDLVRGWLITPNAHLDHVRPIDYMRGHGSADVVGVLRAEAAGSYA